MKNIYRIALLIFMVATFSMCKKDKRLVSKFRKFETFYSGNDGRQFTLYLYPDSTFVYLYKPGNGVDYIEKECGKWTQEKDLIFLEQGYFNSDRFKVTPEFGDGDTLEIILNGSPEKLRHTKIILFDTVSFSPEKDRILVNKRKYFDGDEKYWRDFNGFFVSDLKVVSDLCYTSIFVPGQLTQLRLELDTLDKKECPSKGKILFEFKIIDDYVSEVKRNVKFEVGKLFLKTPFMNRKLLAKINEIYREDQYLISSRDTLLFLGKSDEVNRLTGLVKLNCEKIRSIVEQYGFPGWDLVGKDASNNCSIVIQHFDHDVQFQKECLKLLNIEVGKENAAPENAAFLTDRVKVNSGLPQIYGTQVTYDSDGWAIPKPLENKEKVDSLRRSVGLDSLQNYLNILTSLKGKQQPAFKMNIKLQ